MLDFDPSVSPPLFTQFDGVFELLAMTLVVLQVLLTLPLLFKKLSKEVSLLACCLSIPSHLIFCDLDEVFQLFVPGLHSCFILETQLFSFINLLRKSPVCVSNTQGLVYTVC